MPVGLVEEFEAEHLRIGTRVLYRVGSAFVAGLGLNDGDRKVPAVAEKSMTSAWLIVRRSKGALHSVVSLLQEFFVPDYL